MKTKTKQKTKINTKTIRIIIIALLFVLFSVGLIFHIQAGTLSGYGWDAISVLCPMGALTTMIATKTFVPRAVVSLVLAILFIFVLGRAFCAWACPTKLIEAIRNFFRSPKKRRELASKRDEEMKEIAKYELKIDHDCKTCGACKQKHGKFDSRHAVLGGAVLSTAVFGFPVFCLVCPVGLSFATVLLLWRLFVHADLTWSVVIAPALLIIEILVLRKWCTRFCPLSALMNLLSRFGKSMRPVIDESRCIETVNGVPCSQCAVVCDFDINLRHPEYGERTLADCSRCRACVEACPGHAISMPIIPKKGKKGAAEAADAGGAAAVN